MLNGFVSYRIYIKLVNKSYDIGFEVNVPFECNSLISCVLVFSKEGALGLFRTRVLASGAIVLQPFRPAGGEFALSKNSPIQGRSGEGEVNSWK